MIFGPRMHANKRESEEVGRYSSGTGAAFCNPALRVYGLAICFSSTKCSSAYFASLGSPCVCHTTRPVASVAIRYASSGAE